MITENLHSNMVRFIIGVGDMYGHGLGVFTFQYGQIYYDEIERAFTQLKLIYIPIWLDLLQYYKQQTILMQMNLHSNMVRFIIYDEMREKQSYLRFTFQYGQIYYPLEVQFERMRLAFTFQYGQIYYFYFYSILV